VQNLDEVFRSLAGETKKEWWQKMLRAD